MVRLEDTWRRFYMDRYSWKCDRCGVEKHSQYVIQYEVDAIDKEYADGVAATNAEITTKQIKINEEFEKEKDIARQSVKTYNKSHILKKKFVEFTADGYRIDTVFTNGMPVRMERCGYRQPIQEIRHIKCDSCGHRLYL